MCGCACVYGLINWGAGACAAHYEYVCDVRADVDENPRTLKVSGIEISSSHWLNVLGGHRWH